MDKTEFLDTALLLGVPMTAEIYNVSEEKI